MFIWHQNQPSQVHRLLWCFSDVRFLWRSTFMMLGELYSPESELV